MTFLTSYVPSSSSSLNESRVAFLTALPDFFFSPFSAFFFFELVFNSDDVSELLLFAGFLNLILPSVGGSVQRK
jgi:hypothetical protein